MQQLTLGITPPITVHERFMARNSPTPTRLIVGVRMDGTIIRCSQRGLTRMQFASRSARFTA